MPSTPLKSLDGVEEAALEATQAEGAQNAEQYSVFTKLEKWFIVAMVSYASWSANLSTFIYLPALKPLAEAFSVSVAKINLIITIYQAVGAVVPLVVGDAADVLGRRAAYIVTLCLFMVANICLALADSYTTLLGLRMLQAVGQSGIILIGYGVVSDIAPPATRGSFMSVVSFFITASLSTLFMDIYNLSEWQAGLIYLPFALGGTASTFFSGRLLDGAYRRARTKRGLATDRIKGDDLDNFPIEKARLTVMWIPMLVIAICTVAYGWVLQYQLHLAISMVLQFVTGMAMQLNFSSFNTLLVDINHRSPSAANASTSVVRYAFSAIVVAFIEDMFHSLGIGWSFTLIAGFNVMGIGFLAVEYVLGMSWRREAASQKLNGRVC
ncbi:hypothetical protein VMCG_02976 [Cytospora schulzeri]|uniref:Major facilitator superfamily (MFS) profile domain-containing protein n=1 Tax=Cytospora schulzeri TaxID=448051 RepID=A0A423WZ18_9PEZI|nr:hypothetical protein VMCG_02976 [Valsa malicola]